MATAVAIADDVADVARAIATRDGRSLDDIVSDAARQSLLRLEYISVAGKMLPVLPKRGVVVTLETVNALRDEEP